MNASPAVRVVGQGPVGLAFALFSVRAGLSARSIVFDPPPAVPAAVQDALARRRLALSLGSWQLLSRIAVAPAAAPICDIEVSLQGSAGKTHLGARASGVPALGYVCDYGALVRSLERAWGDADGAAAASGSEARSADAGGPNAHGSGSSEAPPAQALRVTVHAEGLTGDEASVREFDQQAIQATLHCPNMPAGLALERFTAQGPAALLPVAQPQRFSLVWCAGAQASERRAGLSPRDFIAELQTVFGSRLQDASLIDERICTPLQRRRRRVNCVGHEVWIGNAAQSLHPVAGQGLNLGLRDAFTLAQCLGSLARARAPVEPDALAQALAAYARRRARDRGATIGLTDTLASLFTHTSLAPLQSAALAALDLAPGLKQAVGERFMFGSR